MKVSEAGMLSKSSRTMSNSMLPPPLGSATQASRGPNVQSGLPVPGQELPAVFMS